MAFEPTGDLKVDLQTAILNSMDDQNKSYDNAKPSQRNKVTQFANELINAGIDLIGKDRDNAWMKGMYFTDNQKRKHYTPLHELYGKFDCPIVDSYSNRIDWISIFD